MNRKIDKKGKSFFFRNGLSIVFLFFFIVAWIGQAYTGLSEHNEFLQEHNQPPLTIKEYLSTGHFIQATFENWESEFMQMALFVIFTIFLRQKGSAESKKLDAEFIDSSTLVAKDNSPWSVKKGGIFLAFYKHSLSIILLLIFLFCFIMHLYGSWLDHNQKQLLEGKNEESVSEFLTSSKMWFESFQNWQSEFLSVFAIIFLSIYLRQIGSSQSKEVNEPHSKTGDN